MKNSGAAAFLVLVSTLASAALHAETPSKYIVASVNVSKLAPLSGIDSEALDINDAGHVVGSMTTVPLESHAFFYKDGTVVDIGPKVEHASSDARAINASDVVAGTWGVDGDGHAFRWAAGNLVNLKDKDSSDSPDAKIYSSAHAISDAGVIAGVRSPRATSHFTATVWTDDETFRSVTSPDGPSSVAVSLSDSGLVVGAFDIRANSNIMKAWKFFPTFGLEVDVPSLKGCSGGAWNGIVYGVNRQGEMVGSQTCRLPKEERAHHAFYWNGTDKFPSDLCGGTGAGECSAHDINDGGFIIGHTGTNYLKNSMIHSNFIYHRDFGMYILPKLAETPDTSKCDAWALNNLKNGRVQVVGSCATSEDDKDARAVVWDVMVAKR